MIDKITPITYEEAAILLGKSIETVNQAQSKGRNVLSKLPRTGQKQLVIKEQVELFKGRKLSTRFLKPDQLALWKAYDEVAKGNSSPVQSDNSAPVQLHQVAESHGYKTFNMFPDAATMQYMEESGKTCRVKPGPDGELLFQLALADKEDKSGKVEEDEPDMEGIFFSTVGLWLILLGIIILIGMNSKNARKADRTLEQMNIEREELHPSQREIVFRKMRNHPQGTQDLEHILQEENLIPKIPELVA